MGWRKAAFWGLHPWTLPGNEGQEEWKKPGKHQGKENQGPVTDLVLTMTAVLVLGHLVRGRMRPMACTSTGRLHVDDGTGSMDSVVLECDVKAMTFSGTSKSSLSPTVFPAR